VSCERTSSDPQSGEAGYAIFELLVVMVITGVILVGVATTFAAGLRAESGATRRATAQENARIALNRMRTDIHCASGAPAAQENPFGGFTLTLTQSPGTCPAVTMASAGVQWCTIPHPESPSRWQLFRFLGTDLVDCDGSAGSELLVDFVAEPVDGWPANDGTDPVPADWDGNVWPTPPTCSAGHLPRVAVDLALNVDPDGFASEGYRLRDAITLRNALRCV
jgi:type II secretory pathway pseudopilin PulG